jgi:hypothetical protein
MKMPGYPFISVKKKNLIKNARLFRKYIRALSPGVFGWASVAAGPGAPVVGGLVVSCILVFWSFLSSFSCLPGPVLILWRLPQAGNGWGLVVRRFPLQ